MNLKEPSSYRDQISTVDASGKRNWIYPSIPKGAYHEKRKWVAWLLIAFMALVPFVKVDGRPIFLFNIVDRHFILFGQPFWPQDLKILFLVLITFIVFIVVFTAIWGRLWCGWTCPQTVFLEMVFRKVEFWIEGDGLAQKKLNKEPWHRDKIIKKASKHAIFLTLSYSISHIFLSWIIGVDELIQIIREPIADHVAGFVAINVFSLMFYGVFAWFREQACVMVCPYGRFQSVLLDKDTTVISYDHIRGEPRGKATQKTADENVGDCVNCHQCVRVCPTGIDIRHGTQLECVNCTACIDACDHIMDKLKRPKGLIRFASSSSLESGQSGFQFTTRMKAYTAVLVLLLCCCVALLNMRSDVHIGVTRLHGSVYQQLDDGSVINLFKLKMTNNTFDPQKVMIVWPESLGLLRAPPVLEIKPYGHGECVVNVILKKEELRRSPLILPIQFKNEQGQVIAKKELTFLGPQT